MQDANENVKRPALYIIASPIGNLSDLSYRAESTLRILDCVLAEDTKKTKVLMNHYNIVTPVRHYFEQDSKDKANEYVKKIKKNEAAWGLITDAGTPLVSDPGYRLVKECVANDIEIISIPGASAVMTCLALSDIPVDKFVFEGFLPTRKASRERRLRNLVDEERTIVFFEAPHRIVDFLESLVNVVGASRKVVIGREMTKYFETIYRGSLEKLLTKFKDSAVERKGEFTILLAGNEDKKSKNDKAISQVIEVVRDEVDSKTAVRLISKLTGLPRNVAYKKFLERNS